MNYLSIQKRINLNFIAFFSLIFLLVFQLPSSAQDKTFVYSAHNFSDGTATILQSSESASLLAKNDNESLILAPIILSGTTNQIIAMAKSTDGGLTWQRISVPTLSDALTFADNIQQFDFYNGKFYLLVRQQASSIADYSQNISRLFHSADGTTWTEVTDANFKAMTFYNYAANNATTYSHIERITFKNGKYVAMATEYKYDNYGYRPTKTTLSTSSDGSVWTTPINLFTEYRDANGINNISEYVGLSYTAAGLIFFSENKQFLSQDDGATWARTTLPVNYWVIDFQYIAGTGSSDDAFWLVSRTSTSIYKSEDAVTWTAVSGLPISRSWNAIDHVNGIYVASGNSVVYDANQRNQIYSLNGMDWFEMETAPVGVTVNNAGLFLLEKNGIKLYLGTFYGIKHYFELQNIGALASFDVYGFASTHLKDEAIENVKIIAKDANGNRKLNYNATVSYSGSAGISGSVTFSNGIALLPPVKPTNLGSNLQFTIADGAVSKTISFRVQAPMLRVGSWRKEAFALNTPTSLFKTLLFENGVYNAMSVRYGQGALSGLYPAQTTDGVNWTFGNHIGSYDDPMPNNLVYGDGKFLSVVSPRTELKVRSLSSTDGLNFTVLEDSRRFYNSSARTALTWTDGVYGNGRFVFSSLNQPSAFSGSRDFATFAYSLDGINVNQIQLDSYEIDFTSLAYGNGKFIAVGYKDYNASRNDKTIIISEDGINWNTDRTGNIDPVVLEQWNDVAFGNGKFVVVGNGKIAHSTDGLTWTKIISPSNYWISDIKYLGGLFVTLGAHYIQNSTRDNLNYNRILWSRDGVNWNTSRVSEYVEGGEIAFNGTNYIITNGLSQFVITGTDVFSNDADLTNIQISEGQIQGIFDKAVLAYTSSPVTYDKASLKLTATASNPSVFMQVRNNGGAYQEVVSGVASQAIPLAFGANSIEVLVTAEDGTTKTYTLSITRELSPVNTLSNLQISQGLIEQTFSSSLLTYTGLASSTTTSLTVTPTATDPNSLVEISFDNGTTYTPINSAQASSALTLANGDNVIKVKVTSQLTRGTASPVFKEYVLTVYKTGPFTKFEITGHDWSTKTFNAFYPIEGIILTALDANDKRDISFNGTVNYGGTAGITGTSASFVNGQLTGLSVSPIESGNPLTFTITRSGGTETGSVDLNVVDLTSLSTWSYPTIPSGYSSTPNFITADFDKDKALIVSSQGGTAIFKNQSLTRPTVNNFYAVKVRFNNDGKGASATQIRTDREPIQVYFDGDLLKFEGGTSTRLSDQDMHSLAFGESKFLALSKSSFSFYQLLSSDGLTWGTNGTWLQKNFSFPYWDNMIAHGYNANGESIFVAFYDGSTTNRGIPGVALFRESDLGVNNFLDPYSAADITTAPPSTGVDWSGGGMAYGNGVFVAASETGQVISSPDGVNWTYRTIPAGLSTQIWASVAFGNGVFMVMSKAGKIITSPDGIVWREGNHLTGLDPDYNQFWNEVRYGNGTFLAVGYNTVAYANVTYTDAFLKNLVVNQGTFTSKFSSTRFAYSMSVPNAQASIKFTPTVSDSRTTLTINGTAITSGQESAAINLNVGTNTITIVTTNGGASQTYTVTVTREPSAIANLSGLSLNTTESPANAISYSPTFDAATVSYTASSVNHSISQITVTPTTASAQATVAVRVGSGSFQAVTSGSASPALDLEAGSNVIDVKVTAEDGTTIKTYSITVIRKSNNADLSDVISDLGILVPAFDPEVTTYDISVEVTDAAIKFTPTLSDANASMTINGTAIANNAQSAAIALNAGAITNVVIRVTSEDGVTTKDYTFRVSRAALADADLSAILFEYNNVAQRFEATLDPVFDKNTQLYRTTVYTPQIKVRATSVDANATVSIRLNSGAFVTLTPGQFPAPFDLTIGSSNVIDIKVVAQDGNTEKIYSLIVTRKIAKPTITAINPRVAKPTDEITLTGTNFGATAAENTVWFGSVKGEITQATATEIKVKVPFGAQHTPLKVINTTSKYVGESSLSFVPTFDNADNKNLEWKAAFEVSSPVISATYGNARFIGDLADLNGDGKLDIIKVNNSGSKISIYQNASTPGDLVSTNFSSISTVDVLSSPREVKAADLNNDGLTDLIVTYESSSFSYFINTSASNTLSFAQRVDVTGGGNMRSPHVADVNNDGKQDIILYSPSSTAIRIFPNTMADQSTTFALGTEITLTTASANINDLVVRDINNDGLSDLVYVRNGSDIRVRLNTNALVGQTSFAAETSTIFGSNNITILADDVQLDDEIDYLVAPSSSTRDGSIYSKNSSISITNFNSQSINSSQSSINLAIADLNGDGKPDLLNSSSLQTNTSPHEVILAVNNNDVGAGKTISGSNFTVGKLNFPTAPTKYGVVFPGDLDLDGKPDILHVTENKIYVFRNKTKEDPTLTVTGTLNPFVICGSTATNSASQTITVSGEYLTQNVSINARNGLEYSLDDQNYSTTLSIPVTGGTLAATTVYVRMNTTFASNATAAIQIYSTNQNAFVAASTSRESTDIVISGNGPVLEAATLQLTANVPAAATTPWVSSDPTLATIDANGLLTALDAGTVTITFTSQAGCTATKSIMIIEPVAVPITVTSFTPVKGKQGEEITITGTGFGATAAENVVFFGTVKGEITAASATEIKVKVPFGARTHNLVVVNTTDHVSAQSGRSFVYTFDNDDTPGTITNSNFTSQGFSAVTSGDLYTAVNFGTVGDLDGDGKVDLIKLDYNNGKLAVYKNQAVVGTLASSSFAAAQLFTVDANPIDLDIADLNNDGLLDLAITYNTSSISVLINKSVSGTIDFEANQSLTLASTFRDLRIGDLDRDGKPDLIFPIASTFSIYRNTTTAGSSTITLDAEYSLPTLFSGSPTIGSISSFTLKDLNKDGLLDIALSSSSNVFGFINTNLNPGSLSFTTGVSRAVGGSISEIFLEDLNQDGNNDLFLGYLNSTRGGLIQNNYSSGTITDANLPFTGNIDGVNSSNNRSVQLEVADFNGDAKPDLINTDRDNGGWSQSLFIVTNNSAQGTGTTMAASNFVSNLIVSLNKFGGAYGVDLDNDKKPDWVAFTENNITLGRNKFGESPSIRVTGTFNDFYRCGTDPSPAQSIDVRGSFLQNNISISDVYGVLEFSTDGNTYSNNLTLTPVNGVLAQTKVYVRFKSSSTSNITYKITLTSSPATTQEVNYKTIYNATPITLTGTRPMEVGTTLQLTGSGAAAATNAWTSSNTSVATISSTGLVTSVAEGKTTIIYTSQNGCAATYDLVVYTKTAAPVEIASIVPNKGRADEEIEITGTGFGSTPAENVVYFGAVAAEIVSASATSIKLKVPASALSVPITIVNTTTNKSVTSSESFLYTFNNPSPTTIQTTNFTSSTLFTNVNSAPVNGSFQPGVVIDVDGDRKADLVKLLYNDKKIRIYRNQTSIGTIAAADFSSTSDISVSGFPAEVEVEDINNDGKLDLVLTYGNSSDYGVFINTSTTGSVSFAAEQTFTAGGLVRMMRIADWNNDGLKDLVMANYQGNTAYIHINTTSTPGTTVSFSPETTITSSAFGSFVNFDLTSIVVRDINRDGLPDIHLVSRSFREYYLLINTNYTSGIFSMNTKLKGTSFSGSFFGTVYSGNALVEDLNRDGKQDMLFGAQLSTGYLRQNNISGSTLADADFGPQLEISNFNSVLQSSANAGRISIADFNGDSKPDIINPQFLSSSASLSIITNNSAQGSGTTMASSNFTSGYSVSDILFYASTFGIDLDQDGKPDIVSFDQNSIKVGKNRLAESPLIRVEGTLSAFGRCGSTSPASSSQEFFVSGVYLTNDITIAARSGLEYSLNGTNFSNTLVLTRSNARVERTKIYVRMTSSANSTSTDAIRVLSTGATDVNITASTIYSATNPIISGGNTVEATKTLQLSANQTASQTNPWTSSNSSIATVSNSGLVSALAAGQVTITFKSNTGCETSVTIQVEPASGPQDTDGDGTPDTADPDDDGDGVNDDNDQCPNTPKGASVDTNGCAESQKDTDEDGIPDDKDPDDDGDGTPDDKDAFPKDPDEDKDKDGDGTGDNADTDDDGDGVNDDNDKCPNTEAGESVDADGCSTADKAKDTDEDGTPDVSDPDDDGDGVNDDKDQCEDTPKGVSVDANGCAESQKDTDKDGAPDDKDPDDDGDGTPDQEDTFPKDPDEDKDSDGDGTGDNADPDDDNDGVNDDRDQCPDTPSTESVDASGCSESQQEKDTDGDGKPDKEDTDDDGDGTPDDKDAFPKDPDEDKDSDGDGTGDNADTDDDNDGVNDDKDLCPNTAKGESVDVNGCSTADKEKDTDGDGTPDVNDPDDDGDGVNDDKDQCADTAKGSSVDANGCAESQKDTDGDGIPDDKDPDDDGDGTPDSKDVFPKDPDEDKDSDGDGTGDNADTDDDNDGVNDDKDLCPNTATGESVDANGCSTTDKEKDTDGDGTPDVNDPDDDGDGVNDDKDKCADTPKGATVDANGCAESQNDTDADGIPDDKDPDDDGDGTPDSTDEFPKDPEEDKDSDGDGTGDNADTDDDNDGVNDAKDLCPNTAKGESVDANGCSTADKEKDTDGDGNPDVDDPDDDGDGTPDDEDAFPKDPNEDKDGDGDGTGDNSDEDNDNDGVNDEDDMDDDGDGKSDDKDAFPKDPKEDKDSDGDGTGDNADPDDDNDGVNDNKDLCPNTATGASVDANGCSTADKEKDTDGDGIPDVNDPDDDDDKVNDGKDQCAETSKGEAADNRGCAESQKDTDADGITDDEDTDDDGDGTPDDKDAFPKDPAEDKDSDGDGTGDNADPDDDNDGVNDKKDQCPATASGDSVDANGCSNADLKDTDGDGLSDYYEAKNQAPTDLALSATTIVENSAIGTRIGQLSSLDALDPYAHTYTFVSGIGDTNNANFEIVGNELKVKEVFDFEKKSSYTIRIRTTDAGALNFEKAFTITIKDVNEAPTVLALSKQNIYEENSIDDIVGLLSTTDQDAGDAHTYTLVTGSGSTDNAAFKIVNGQLRAAQSFKFATKYEYSIRVRTTDKAGLSTEQQFSITISEKPTITGTGNETYPFTRTAASTNPSISLGYSTRLNVGGSDIVSYNWTPSTGLSSTSLSNPEAKPKVTTTYTVEVTNRFGSKTTISITVTVREDYVIVPNNIISPNGDGENDVWIIQNLDAYPDNKVSIFDRAGRLIYSKTNYTNDWNGQLNGSYLVEDTYYYVISINGGKGEKVGFITIVR